MKPKYIFAFIVVTLCFALWGFDGSFTNPMVKAFSKIFKMSVFDGTLVQVAFYGGYFAMAIPAAIFIRRHTYKSGLVLGLFLMAFGACLFYPAALSGSYYPFLVAYFVMTCGQSFLETSANPLMLTLGDKSTAAFRLNLAQSFNPLGCLAGMYAAMVFVQQRLSPLTADQRDNLSASEFDIVKMTDLDILSTPYLLFGVFALILAVVMYFTRMPKEHKSDDHFSLFSTFRRVIRCRGYKMGFLAQFFYVGAQVMCWTFIIQYGTSVFMEQGMAEGDAEVLAQKYNIIAMILFCTMRFVCTFLMKFFRPASLLALFSVMAITLALAVALLGGYAGLVCLVAISGCMSLMFPTIYSLALRNLDGEDAKIGAAGQIMSILGGSLLPLVQATVIDQWNVTVSFVVPMISFIVITYYALRSIRLN